MLPTIHPYPGLQRPSCATPPQVLLDENERKKQLGVTYYSVGVGAGLEPRPYLQGFTNAVALGRCGG